MVDEQVELATAELQALHSGLESAANKGKALEDFCCLFFGALPGIEVAERNILDDAVSQEIDIALYNDQHPSGLPRLDEILLVEAKNWRSPVGSAEVAWLDWKVRLSGRKQGFLVAMNGITGRIDDRTSAWQIVHFANIEGRQLIILTPGEMIACSTALDFAQLVRQKMMRVAVGKAQIT